MEDIIRLAFSVIDNELFPPPSWLLDVDELSLREVNHASLIANAHRASLEEFDSDRLKLTYFACVLDAQRMLNNE